MGTYYKEVAQFMDAIDDSKLKALGWQPTADFDQELQKVMEYYMLNFIW